MSVNKFNLPVVIRSSHVEAQHVAHLGISICQFMCAVTKNGRLVGPSISNRIAFPKNDTLIVGLGTWIRQVRSSLKLYGKNLDAHALDAQTSVGVDDVGHFLGQCKHTLALCIRRQR